MTHTLPLRWKRAKIGEITLPFDSVQPSQRPDDDFRYVDIGCIDNTKQKIAAVKVFKGCDAPSRARRVIREGDVLFSTVRTYLRNIASVPAEYDGDLTSTGICVLRSSDAVDPGYLFRWTTSDAFVDRMSRSMDGTMYPAITDNDLFTSDIALPPLNEQRRIVAKIEALMARSARAKGALDAIPVLLDRYRQSVLAAAFRGDLTTDWREQHPAVEPVSELLARILAERRALWLSGRPNNSRKRYKEPVSLDPYGLPTLPKTWTWITLGHLAWSVKDGPHYSPQYVETGIPFITGGNVRPDGVNFENVKYISPELHQELSKRCKPEIGDILYTKGGTTGIARVNTYDLDFNVWVHVAVLKCVRLVHPFFIQHALNSPACFEQSQKFTHGVGNQDLGLTRMINIVLPLAPLDEQAQMVRLIDHQLAAIAKIERFLSDQPQRLNQLNGAILAKAFRGELVPQDPNDEPASELLARIKAERASNPQHRGRGRKRSSGEEPNDMPLFPGSTSTKPLADILNSNSGAMKPEALWQASGLSIDDFYKQLKREVEGGLIQQDKDKRLLSASS